MSDDTNAPPIRRYGRPRKPGRPGYDWDALYIGWLHSGMDKNAFLKARGVAFRGGSALKHTARWIRDLNFDQYQTLIANQGAELREPTSPEKHEPIHEAHHSEVDDACCWQQVMARRSSQGISDWQSADSVRTHIELILEQGMSCRICEDGQVGLSTTLTPQELRQLAKALSDVQRVQRMALGLTSDDVGKIPQGECLSEPPQAVDGEHRKNMFIVELSRSGRFIHARPRRVI